ncbi:4-hydroxyphenylacetate 3-hydroxylase N-terminal domain-containing protein [Neobacillus sp. BF23-41]|uniref:4-hydroxyphenylacetate 3-hydroxylase N-terminal domain-containing protein n=1 Tax=Neobacillus sp. BF23-41 TaxID=3240280 RepID=UPI0034E52D51
MPDFPGKGRNPQDYPIATKFEETDTKLIFDNVLIPWENVLFPPLLRICSLYPLHTSSLFCL